MPLHVGRDYCTDAYDDHMQFYFMNLPTMLFSFLTFINDSEMVLNLQV